MEIEQIKRKYRRNARLYDRLVARPTARLRRKAIEWLELRPGQRVLDLGCGTGLSLPLLADEVGREGVVYGVEVSREMLAEAKRKVEKGRLDRVRLVEADAEHFDLPEPVDAILCFFTHDLLLSPTALPRAMRQLGRGGRVVAAGVKLARGWRGWLINPLTIAYSLPAISTRDFARSYRPYASLETLLDEFQVDEWLFGSLYLARATRKV